jgi:hypothetical protein
MAEDEQAMTVRLPKPLYEQLRRAAYEAHKPMSQIVIAAVNAALKGEQS